MAGERLSLRNMETFVLAALGLACAIGGCMLTIPLWQPENVIPESKRLAVWLGKGLLLPMAIWTAMNLGLAWNLQPFMPAIQAAKNIGKGWEEILFYFLAVGFFLISSSWSATTVGWGLGLAWKKTKDDTRAQFKDLCATCALFLCLPVAGLIWLGGWPVVPLAAALLLGTIAGFAPPIIHRKARPPMYSRAIARLKFGKYSDAEWEIIRELENTEDDFEGWMMLADLYANHFHDLKEAERTVLEICTRPDTTAPELSIALHRLADWNLKISGDLAGARFALGLISERLPGTHLARMAELRIAQLPETLEELRQRKGTRAAVRLPALGDSLDQEPPAPISRAERAKAAELANACVEKLNQDPNNVPAREKLARLFAERLNKAELGIEQLTLLLDLPDESELRRAEWLSLIAAWNLKYLHDSAAARIVLERLATEFPNTPQSLAARRRLQLMSAQPSR